VTTAPATEACSIHRRQAVPCSLCAMEERIGAPPESRLGAMASYLEKLTGRLPLSGELQGDALHIASLLRELAKKVPVSSYRPR
jgi:hypothetical protein